MLQKSSKANVGNKLDGVGNAHSLIIAASIRGRRLFQVFLKEREATIQGRPLLKGGVYSRKYGSDYYKLNSHAHTCRIKGSIWYATI